MIDAYLLIKGLFYYWQLHENKKRRRKRLSECIYGSSFQEHRDPSLSKNTTDFSLRWWRYAGLPTRKNNRSLSLSLYKQKSASASISVCEYNKRLYISLPLQVKKASASIFMCEYNKRLYISLLLQAKKCRLLSLCASKKTESICLSLSTNKKRRRLLSLCASIKNESLSISLYLSLSVSLDEQK